MNREEREEQEEQEEPEHSSLKRRKRGQESKPSSAADILPTPNNQQPDARLHPPKNSLGLHGAFSSTSPCLNVFRSWSINHLTEHNQVLRGQQLADVRHRQETRSDY